MKILQTDRLLLREFEESDAPFILDLLNSEGWLRYIGDRGVRDLAGAEGYLRKGPITSYRENGFGLWMVELLEGGIPVGMCGFINRDTLEDIDIGYALHPDHYGKGYALEAAQACMRYARHCLVLPRVVAVTDPGNESSIALLKKLGFRFAKQIDFANSGEPSNLYQIDFE